MKTASSGLDTAALSDLVARANAGEADALDAVVRALQHDVYRLALRMTACREDAEDATQEVLIKVVTRLGSFRGDASVRTWAYRITVRHLLDRKKSRVEAMDMQFERFGHDLIDGLAARPDPDPVAAEEVKRGCTLAMLTCLDRDHRVAYILTDVFDLPHLEAADVCGISEDVHRQRLSRARRALEAFTRSYCGLVVGTAPCHCSRRVECAEALGRLHRGALALATHPAEDIAAAIEEMAGLHETARLMRQHPQYEAPARVLEQVSSLLLNARRTPG